MRTIETIRYEIDRMSFNPKDADPEWMLSLLRDLTEHVEQTADRLTSLEEITEIPGDLDDDERRLSLRR